MVFFVTRLRFKPWLIYSHVISELFSNKNILFSSLFCIHGIKAMTAANRANRSSVSSGVVRGTPPISSVSPSGFENPSVQLSVHKLNGKNCMEWA